VWPGNQAAKECYYAMEQMAMRRRESAVCMSEVKAVVASFGIISITFGEHGRC
jgi:hypothetical protein